MGQEDRGEGKNRRRGEVSKVRPTAMKGEGGPSIATVVPVYNEALHIEACLESLMHQSLPPEQHMVLVLDGGSTDETRRLVRRFMDRCSGPEFPMLQLVENPSRTVPHARNLALQLLPESVVFLVEMIGHAKVEANHLEQRLEAWRRCKAMSTKPLAGVGVRVIASNEEGGRTARWVESVLASRFGQSGGQFSPFRHAGPTDVPAFVMHDRSAVEGVGGWDTSFITSQDSDLSMRLLKSGYALYRSPEPSVAMHKRTTLRQWWRMGHRYGFWRTKVLMRHPKRAKWQEFLPWLGLVGTMGLFLGGASSWWMLAATYMALLAFLGISHGWAHKSVTSLVGVPLCFLMLHTSFSVGLLDGLLRRGRHPRDRG